MTRNVGRSDRYEAQLSDGELLELHTSLLSGKVALEKIRNDAPAWRLGPNAGKKPSLATLSNMRDRLLMEESFKEDAATTESILEELKREAPELDDAKLDDLGHRTFALMTIRRQDLKGFVKLRTARERAKLEHAKLDLRRQEVARQEKSLELEEKRFQRDTCKMFLKWVESEEARKIATAPGNNDQKIESLGKLMFGELWR